MYKCSRNKQFPYAIFVITFLKTFIYSTKHSFIFSAFQPNDELKVDTKADMFKDPTEVDFVEVHCV